MDDGRAAIGYGGGGRTAGIRFGPCLRWRGTAAMDYTLVMKSAASIPLLVLLFVLHFVPAAHALDMSRQEVEDFQRETAGLPVGERIALWAEKFVGTPYDPDPLGEYVTRRAIVADDRVDCMYLTFRSAELALSETPDEAVRRALDMRFHTHGVVRDGEVVNYEERYQYAIDMLRSGKWGRDITPTLPGAAELEGSRGIRSVTALPAGAVPRAYGSLRSGDIVFFVKEPSKRVVGEIVGHIGILKREGDGLFLIHAGGRKNAGGEVVKVPFGDYLSGMPFWGIMVGRF